MRGQRSPASTSLLEAAGLWHDGTFWEGEDLPCVGPHRASHTIAYPPPPKTQMHERRHNSHGGRVLIHPPLPEGLEL